MQGTLAVRRLLVLEDRASCVLGHASYTAIREATWLEYCVGHVQLQSTAEPLTAATHLWESLFVHGGPDNFVVLEAPPPALVEMFLLERAHVVVLHVPRLQRVKRAAHPLVDQREVDSCSSCHVMQKNLGNWKIKQVPPHLMKYLIIKLLLIPRHWLSS